MKKVVVIGASSGIGLEFTKQYLEQGCQVTATCRILTPELAALKAEYPLHLKIFDKIDISHDSAIATFAEQVPEVDLLILNAGIKGYDTPGMRPSEHTREQLIKAFLTNTVGPDDLMRLFFPKLQHANAAAVLISTAMASIQDNTSGGLHPYRISKTAALPMIQNWAIELAESWQGDLADLPCAFAIAPGWVRTRMGGPNARLSARASVAMMIETIERAIASKQINGLIMYHGEMLDVYQPHPKLKEAIQTVKELTKEKIQKTLIDRQEEILLRLMTPAEFSEATHHDFPDLEESLKKVYAKSFLHERADALIELRANLQQLNYVQLSELTRQVDQLLQFIFNAHEEIDDLDELIADRQNLAKLGASIVIYPHSMLPGRSILTEIPLVPPETAPLSTIPDSPRSHYNKIQQQIFDQALQQGQLKEIRPTCKRNDTHFGTRILTGLEREATRILPYRLHAGFIQIIGNQDTGLMVLPFSSKGYVDINGAEGICMFIMTEHGEIFVGSRQWFPTESSGISAILHSSLAAGKPVVCAGLLATEKVELSSGKIAEALIFLSNSTGHYKGELPHLKQMLHVLKTEGVYDPNLNADFTLVQNCRNWPPATEKPRARVFKQGFPVLPELLLATSMDELFKNETPMQNFVAPLSEQVKARGFCEGLSETEATRLIAQTTHEQKLQYSYSKLWHQLQQSEQQELIELKIQLADLIPEAEHLTESQLTQKFNELKQVDNNDERLPLLQRCIFLTRWSKPEEVELLDHKPTAVLTSWN